MSNVSPGDRVNVNHKGIKYSGIVMPKPEGLSNMLLLKLDNGYNIGININNKTKIIKSGKPLKQQQAPKLKTSLKSKLPNITIISTGGTITSNIDYKTGAVRSLIKPSELLARIPELTKIANIKLINPFNIMSEDMTFHEWRQLAVMIAKELNSKTTGIIITHGTDTLHFTAAALSFMLEDLNKPVALVGGQRSSDRGSFDGAQNLICATHYCTSNIAEVATVMHANSSDDYCIAIRGTKSRKMHTSRRDAFRPINDLPLAKIWPNGRKNIILKNYRKRSNNKVRSSTKFDPKVALIYTYPGASPDIIDYYIDKGYNGIIISGTGLGHVPTQTVISESSWIKQIKRAINNGVFIGITSQCLYGRTNPNVYSNLRVLKEAGAVHLEDMLPEVAYIKLGWVLGNEHNPIKIKDLMLTNFSGEISKRILARSFLY